MPECVLYFIHRLLKECFISSPRKRNAQGQKSAVYFPLDLFQSGHTLCIEPRRFASSATVATTSSSSGGLLSWLTGSQSKSIPPLDFPLPGVAIPPSLPDYVEPGKIKITTLPNGIKVASEISAFLGSRFGYTFDALKTNVPEMVEFLIDCVRNPAFLDWEVNEQLQKVKEEISEAAKNPHGLLLEAIHSAGYSVALANPLLAPESAVNLLYSTVLEDFVAENFTASRMVLAATGVEHEELLSIAEPLLSDLPKVPFAQEPNSVYAGGDYRCQADSGDLTHFALAFELPGGWHNEKEAMILTVLQILMGGGGTFSAGGPGKGMYSRLFEQKELDRAKRSTKSAILMNLESRPVVHFLKIVDEITPKDISSVAQKLLSSNLTMASYGNVINVPRYDYVSSKFKGQ
ncbi:Mitochondrial-processing peptidase subunit alpha [Hibiscus syriacus]|uniref:Mitochondrial-processing peptidase subunit alpha n=1 Tax=Hibiscus syriacus TaxID=106335 RepID=A0A6A2Z8B8_HIBSY|nr:Mitochondrial-processing peptidase subunit alpha [Hibiscus syriacus]